MSDLTGRSKEYLVLELMHRGLRVNDPELNALAAELLGRLGTHPVRRLVLAAARRGNPAGYRLRALAVLRRIGGRPASAPNASGPAGSRGGRVNPTTPCPGPDPGPRTGTKPRSGSQVPATAPPYIRSSLARSGSHLTVHHRGGGSGG